MRGSYTMVDPLGRFFDNVGSGYSYSEPILEVGVQRALSQIRFDPGRLVARGGIYG